MGNGERSVRRPGIAAVARNGSVAIAAGLLTLGLTQYLFLVLAGHLLGDAGYAPLGVMWILVFLLASAVLYPIEQELSRAIAARRARGEGIGPVVRRGALVAAGFSVVVLVVLGGVSAALVPRLLDGQWLLAVALMLSVASYAIEYVVRGVLAGTGRLHRYAVLIAGEGLWRLVGAVVIALAGVKTAGGYGLLVAAGPALGAAVSLVRSGRLLGPGPEADIREISASLGSLVTAGVLSQALANAAPLAVAAMLPSDEQDLAGAFLKAVVITRIPVFLFQALQAVMLPRLTHLATNEQHADFRTVLVRFGGLVVGIGAAGALGVALVGDIVLRVFGSDYPLPRTDLVLLAVGNGTFLLALTAAQALVALRGQAQTIVGWAAGLVTFFVCLALPGKVVRVTEWGLVVASAVATIVTLALVRRRLRSVRGDVEALTEAIIHEAPVS